MLASNRHVAPARDTDAAAIRSLEQNFVEAFRAKDVRKIMSCFAPGNDLLVFDLSTPRQHAGHDAYTKDWEGFAARSAGPLTMKPARPDAPGACGSCQSRKGRRPSR